MNPLKWRWTAKLLRWLRCLPGPWKRRAVLPENPHFARLGQLADDPYELTTDAWESDPGFRFNELADAIAKTILESDPQLTLAVYARWGAGKTTLLRAVEQRVRSDHCAVGWFDMWEHKDVPTSSRLSSKSSRRPYDRTLGLA